VFAPREETDVFIVGGGPAGLAAAIAARQKGFSVVLADGSEPPIDKACGEGMMPGTLEALAALGVSALLVGAAGWAGLEVARRFLNQALDRTSGDIRQVADAMVNHAEGSLHQWLNLTLAAGGVLVVLGVIFAMLGGLRRRD